MLGPWGLAPEARETWDWNDFLGRMRFWRIWGSNGLFGVWRHLGLMYGYRVVGRYLVISENVSLSKASDDQKPDLKIFGAFVTYHNE